MTPSRVQQLAAHVIALPIADKLRFAADVLEDPQHDDALARTILQYALEELTLARLLKAVKP